MVNLRSGERILRFERGDLKPSPRMFRALADVLTVDPVDLLALPNGVDLVALRLMSGFSPEQVAQAAHVSLRSYREWESGLEIPLKDERILSGLAEKLRVPMAEVARALTAHQVEPRESDRSSLTHTS